jgi:hypothetical protein
MDCNWHDHLHEIDDAPDWLREIMRRNDGARFYDQSPGGRATVHILIGKKSDRRPVPREMEEDIKRRLASGLPIDDSDCILLPRQKSPWRPPRKAVLQAIRQTLGVAK